jgi:hypothetical protein
VLVPNKTEDSTFVYTISNGSVYYIVKKSNATTYETANQTCQTKGGYLAVIDSRVQQDIVQNLIKIHMTNFTVTKAAYLFGMAFKKTFFLFKVKSIVIYFTTLVL